MGSIPVRCAWTLSVLLNICSILMSLYFLTISVTCYLLAVYASTIHIYTCLLGYVAHAGIRLIRDLLFY